MSEHLIQEPKPFSTGLSLLLLMMIWAWFYLPWLGARELQQKEGHRACPAREMLQSGDWVVPKLQGLPYLKKPPGFYWTIMLTSAPFGYINEWVLRTPSVLAVLFSSFIIYFWTKSLGGNGFVSGVAMLIMPEFWVKGALGEIDAFFSFLVLASVWTAWKSCCGGFSMKFSLLSGFFLAYAAITKGPIAYIVFYCAVPIWLVIQGQTRWLWSRHFLVINLMGLCLPLIWVYFLIQRFDAEHVMEIWEDEVGSERVTHQSAEDLITYPLGVIFGLMPGSMALAWLWIDKSRYAMYKPIRNLLTFCSAPLLLGVWYLGRKVRYVLPVGPIFALASGLVWKDFRKWIPLSDFGLRNLFIVVVILGGIARIITLEIQSHDHPEKDTAYAIMAKTPKETTVYSIVPTRDERGIMFYVVNPIAGVHRVDEIKDKDFTLMLHREQLDILPKNLTYEILVGSLETRAKDVILIRAQRTDLP